MTDTTDKTREAPRPFQYVADEDVTAIHAGTLAFVESVYGPYRRGLGNDVTALILDASNPAHALLDAAADELLERGLPPFHEGSAPRNARLWLRELRSGRAEYKGDIGAAGETGETP